LEDQKVEPETKRVDLEPEILKKDLSIKQIVMEVIPIIFGLLVGWCQININLIFMGFLNDTIAQDAIGLSQLFINFLGIGVFFGMNGALETLASQALGKHDYKMCGFYLQ
jgi:Na+-driven multidrug efflux pump